MTVADRRSEPDRLLRAAGRALAGDVGDADLARVEARSRSARDRAIGRWLLVVAGLMFLIVAVGGLTRLSESGLSMVEWKPATGWLPPLGEQAWQAEHARYLASPQGKGVNRAITVEQFRNIYWMEWGHRVLARLIGLAVAIPLAWFWWRGRLTPYLKPRLLAVAGLVVAQGALGWAMVASGLVERPSVSHYRLAAHLGLAVALFGWTLALALPLLLPRARTPDEAVARATGLVVAFLFVVLAWGAFVAGLRAGQIHTTFPTMSGYWIPPGLLDLAPWPLNFVENPTAVQFAHRWLAKLLVIATLLLAWRSTLAEDPTVRRAGLLAGVAALLQLGLGVATILTGVPTVDGLSALWGASHVWLAVAHQMGAVLLLSALVHLRFRVRAA